jgi:hypothetical protein
MTNNQRFKFPMRKSVLLLLCLFSVLITHGQEPAPPTQEWCEWAFRQIPDHRNLSEVETRAFSYDFFTHLMTAYALMEWEREKYPEELGEWEFLAYWYAGNGDSPLDEPDHSILYEVGTVQEGKTKVDIIIHAPAWRSIGMEHRKFSMPIVYEKGAWAIDDWYDRDFIERGFGVSMKEQMENYIWSGKTGF